MREHGEVSGEYGLRHTPGPKGGQTIESRSEASSQEGLQDGGSGLLCRQCGGLVTSEHERITVGGRHQHTFANPHGIVFTIGCFRSAPGCGCRGPLTTEWSWFKGFSWRLAHCRDCLSHLGWQYVSRAGERFWGLILDALVSGRDHHFRRDDKTL